MTSRHLFFVARGKTRTDLVRVPFNHVQLEEMIFRMNDALVAYLSVS